MRFVQLVVQLIDLFFGSRQSAASCRRNPVHAPAPGAGIGRGLDESRALQPMQQRIQCPRSDTIPMPPQLLHHGEAEDGLVRSMYKNVDADEPKEKLTLVVGHRIQFNTGPSFVLALLSNFDI